jgi:hypothetical protein
MQMLYRLFIQSGLMKSIAQSFSTAALWLIIGSILFDPFNYLAAPIVILLVGFGMIFTFAIWKWSWSFSLSPEQKLKRSDSSAEAMAILISHLTEEERLTLRDRLVYNAYEDGEISPAFEEIDRSVSDRYS